MRDCENCKHRVMKVEVGKGTPPDHFWGCECWECEFEPTTKNDLALIHTEGLDEEIRCTMCTNYMKSDRGCDGSCVVNKDMYKAVMDAIEKRIQPSVTPQEPSWIPVTDGLPASYKKVLITNGTVTCIGWVSPTDRCWRSDSESEYDIYYDTVAWMPLPKPYKPQESEEQE